MTLPTAEAPQATSPSEPQVPAPAPTPETPPPVASAPAAPEGSPSPAAETAAAAPAQEAPAAEAPNPRDVVKGLSPQERAALLRDLDWQEVFDASDWLKGKVGAQKQKTEREQRAEREALEADVRARIVAEAEDRRLRDALAQGDLLTAGEITKGRVDRETAASEAQQTEAQRAAVIDGATQRTLGQAVLAAVKDLPEDLQKTLLYEPDGTTYRRYAPDKTPAEGLAEFIREAIKHGSERAATARTTDLRREIEAAVRAELNGERLGGEPSPDTGGGTPSAGALTRSEFDAHRGSPTWIDSNLARIQEWMARGQP